MDYGLSALNQVASDRKWFYKTKRGSASAAGSQRGHTPTHTEQAFELAHHYLKISVLLELHLCVNKDFLPHQNQHDFNYTTV